jgi:hypothetical protein
VGPRDGLDVFGEEKISCPYRDSNPGPCSRYAAYATPTLDTHGRSKKMSWPVITKFVLEKRRKPRGACQDNCQQSQKLKLSASREELQNASDDRSKVTPESRTSERSVCIWSP